MDNITSEFFDSVGITVSQPARGFRYGAPSLALSRFVKLSSSDRAAELGAGCGVVSLILAARDRPRSLTAIEIQPELFDILQYNVAENELGAVVECIRGDYRGYAMAHAGEFDCVYANPPFYPAGSGRRSSDPQRAAAHHEDNGTIGELVAAAGLMLKEGGKLALVFPVERRDELMRAAEPEGFSFLRCEEPDDARGCVLVEFKRCGSQNDYGPLTIDH